MLLPVEQAWHYPMKTDMVGCFEPVPLWGYLLLLFNSLLQTMCVNLRHRLLQVRDVDWCNTLAGPACHAGEQAAASFVHV